MAEDRPGNENDRENAWNSKDEEAAKKLATTHGISITAARKMWKKQKEIAEEEFARQFDGAIGAHVQADIDRLDEEAEKAKKPRIVKKDTEP